MDRVGIDMNFSNEKINSNTLLITVSEDRLDSRSAPAFKEYFTKTVSKEMQKIVLDLACVRFMDSSGLGALISSLKFINNQGAIILIGIQPNVEGLMTLTRMDRLFPQYENLEQAVAMAVE